MDATPLDAIRHLHAKCFDRLDWLCSAGLQPQHAWEDEADRLRAWGQNLDTYAHVVGPAPLDVLARTPLTTQTQLLETLETLLGCLKSLCDSPTAQSKSGGFKIAGIDVLSAGADERQALSTLNEVSRSLGEISKATANLFAVFNAVPQDLHHGGLVPRHRRAPSGRDDMYDNLEPSPSASPSPMGLVSNGKRTRGGSQSSPESFVYSPNGHRFGSATSGDMLSHRSHELPPISSLSSSDSFDRSPYDQQLSNGGRVGPYFGPTAGLSMHHNGGGGPMYPLPPRSPYSSYPDPRRHGHRSEESLGYRDMDHLGSQSPRTGRLTSRASAPRSLGRLRIPSEHSDDAGSAATAPKLTKTGRVSKALRGEPVHACNICDKVYTRAEHLRRHKTNHRAGTVLVAEARTAKTYEQST